MGLWTGYVGVYINRHRCVRVCVHTKVHAGVLGCGDVTHTHTHTCVYVERQIPTGPAPSSPVFWVQWGTNQNLSFFVLSPQLAGDCVRCCHFLSPCQLSLQNPQQKTTHTHTQKMKRNWCIQSSMYLYKWCNGNKMYEINNPERFCWVSYAHAHTHTHTPDYHAHTR